MAPRARAAAFLVVTAVLLASSQGAAQAPFAGRTVNLVVGFPPGGGYDRLARTVARHLPKYLPGSPTVVVQNIARGG